MKGADETMGRAKIFTAVIAVAVSFLAVNGCNKKQQSLEEMQAPMSADSLGGQTLDNKIAIQENRLPAGTPVVGDKAAEAVSAAAVPVLEPLPPSGPYKPSAQDIQTALKNAGYYSGNIDGKVGPKTKAAIEEFQKSSGLTADGKVGPKTWAALEKHLTSAAGTVEAEQTIPLQ
jgi:peptidoglycan hydrolase-like protein with peptidoglycan-binding domain